MSGLSSISGPTGKLLRRIHRACRPTLDEPNVALNLEICDLINEKQGNLPHEAAVAVVKLINSRDPQVSELALQLLDYMVKNCGYPFHLQISRKEFLNELVKTFPATTPLRYTRTQRMILGAIEEWNQTICKTSRYKEDLGFIRDMHRLLSQKGYAFPELKREDAAVLNPSDNLKSIEEIQREERLAQSAKLQELIRRGRPQDLREANKLMKIMSGFQDDKVLENTKQRVTDDVERVKRKADIFNEMLTTATNSGRLDPTDETIAELYASLKVAQPKIQTIIQEEQGDEEAVTSMLSLNDYINSLLERYNFLKNGDLTNASKVKVGGGGLNLIDFDDDDDAPSDSGATPNATGNSDPVADLLGELGTLSFNNNSSSTNNGSSSANVNDLLDFGTGGPITLSSPGNTQAASPREQSPNIDTLFSLSGSPAPAASAIKQPAPTPALQSKGLDPFMMDFSKVATPPPAPQQASSRHFINQSANLKIELQISSTTPLTARIYYSSLTLSPISNLQFLIAVPKSYELTLNPQSGNYLAPMTADGVTQDIKITKKVNDGKTSSVKIKWKCDYTLNGTNHEETGVSALTSN